MKIDYQKKITRVIEQGAARRGLTPEAYLAEVNEEGINHAMKTLGLSREEVIAQGLDGKPEYYIAAVAMARERTKKTGVTVTPEEILEENAEEIRSLIRSKKKQ